MFKSWIIWHKFLDKMQEVYIFPNTVGCACMCLWMYCLFVCLFWLMNYIKTVSDLSFFYTTFLFIQLAIQLHLWPWSAFESQTFQSTIFWKFIRKFLQTEIDMVQDTIVIKLTVVQSIQHFNSKSLSMCWFLDHNTTETLLSLAD